MKIGIYCGMDAGNVVDRNIEYIGVDKGVEFLIQQNIQPVLAIGDMDSLSQENLLDDLKIKRYSSIKDDTDTALALDYVFSQGYDEVDLYGVTQGRMDHFMAVICLLEQYQDKHIVVYDQCNKMQVLLPGIYVVYRDNYRYFSLFAFEESVISLKECHYPLEEYHLKRQDPLCVSNQMNNDYAIIETSETILLIQSNEYNI